MDVRKFNQEQLPEEEAAREGLIQVIWVFLNQPESVWHVLDC